MSSTPRRPTTSSASPLSSSQATRRASFSPAVDAILESVEKRRDRVSHAVHNTQPDSASGHRKSAMEPSTTSHPTRHASGYSPARHRASGSAVVPSNDDSNGTAATTTVEFSLKDIPLDGKIAPPVWCEPSPGRGNSSQRGSPRRGGSPMSARLTATLNHSEAMNVTSSTAACLSNPYTDLARDSANLLRRQRVVRIFFESHEDAVRLYVRLQQLLSYRDMGHIEFQQRLQLMGSDEERQSAMADRAQRMAAQEQEIQRIQAALAKADVTSPEFASSMNSLYSTRSGTPSERSARRDGAAKTYSSPCNVADWTGAAVRAAKCPPDASATTTAVGLASAAPQDHKRETNVAKGGAAAAAKERRPLPSPREVSPREAQAARRRSPPQDTSPSTQSIALKELDHSSIHRGSTPQKRGTPSSIAMLPPGSSTRAGGVAATTKARQDESPRPRRTAPFGSTQDEKAPPLTLAMEGDDQCSSLPSTLSDIKDATGATAASDPVKLRLRKATPAAMHTATPSCSHVPIASPPASTESKLKLKSAVAGLVTPLRATRSPQASMTTPHSEDSPLTRFRRQQGYVDPVEHFRPRLPGSATPLGSRPFNGAVVTAAADIQSWSPAEPPMPAMDNHNGGSDAHSGLVSSVKSFQSPSEPRCDGLSGAARAQSPPHYASHSPVKPIYIASTPTDTSIYDELAALERRVGGLEGRTTKLERNATKRAVLDAIRRLRERVALLEDRTSALERDNENIPSLDYLS